MLVTVNVEVTMADDIVRVLRLVEYVGERGWVESSVTNAVHGTKVMPKGRITAVTLHEYPEVLSSEAALDEQHDYGSRPRQQPWDSLEMSVRLHNCIRRGIDNHMFSREVVTVADLLALRPRELEQVPGMGKRTRRELRELLEEVDAVQD
jgi:hypothetical protein